MRKKQFFSILFFIVAISAFAQSKFVLQKGDSDKIQFKLINNLIVFPVEINGVELSFLLDTGVSKPIIFNFLNISEALQINQAERINIRGLGDGNAIEALKSQNNIFRIGDAININQDLYAVFDPSLNFAPRLGLPVHGIIGYDIFKDFVIEVNYSKRFFRLYNPESYEAKICKKCKILDLEFYNNKPYIDVSITQNDITTPVKLLIDSGGSDALWIFEDESKNLIIPDKNFEDFLGRGLSGKVFGKRSKVDMVTIAGLELKRPNVAFPDSTSISYATKFKERSGSVSGEILKRFNMVFDYANKTLMLKRNRNFGNPFYYNKSGIELEHNGVRVVKESDKSVTRSSFDNSNNTSVSQFGLNLSGNYKYVLAPSFAIVEIREGSPSEKAGLQVGDVIFSVNNRPAHKYSMQEIMNMFYGETGKRIKLLIDRNGVQMKFFFQLQSLL